MHIPSRTFAAARVTIVVLWGSLSLMTVTAPYAAANSHPAVAAFLYLFFAPVCHQDPRRSFVLAGFFCAVCHRCSGIYLGGLVASVLPVRTYLRMKSVPSRRLWVICAAAPLLLDALLPGLAIWTNTTWSRFASGFLFGAMLSTLLLPGIEEFLHEAPWQRSRSHSSLFGGGSLWTRKEC